MNFVAKIFLGFIVFFGVSCSNSTSNSQCKPDCSGRQCGDDGCGGTCGKCGGQGVCQDGVCQCDSHAYSDCKDGDLWWFDSCDQPESLLDACEHGCENGACQCDSHAYSDCKDGDLWWFDSCDQPESLLDACEHGCENGACLYCQADCTDLDCGPDPVCGTNCGDCPDGQDCVDGSCKAQGNDCRTDGCPGAYFCDQDTGECVPGCLVDDDCDDGMDCTSNTCSIDHVCITGPLSDCPWPAEPMADSDNITSIEGPAWDNDFYRDLSGAVWNPVTNTLWVCRNSGPSKVWAVIRDNAGLFSIAEKNGERGEWSDFGDLEGLTMADFDEPETLYLMIEGGGHIQEFDFSSYGTAVMVNDWVTTEQLGNDGAEGITFVPDEFLQEQGFVGADGTPSTSTQGMGGLMFVGHQGGGFIHIFDLNRNDSSYLYLGRLKTDRNETAGLEFDRSTGLLFIMHGANHNVVEVAKLSSHVDGGERKLDTLKVYTGPQPIPFFSDNYEGIAVTSNDECMDGHRSFFLTIDGGKLWSLVRFSQFPCE